MNDPGAEDEDPLLGLCCGDGELTWIGLKVQFPPSFLDIKLDRAKLRIGNGVQVITAGHGEGEVPHVKLCTGVDQKDLPSLTDTIKRAGIRRSDIAFDEPVAVRENDAAYHRADVKPNGKLQDLITALTALQGAAQPPPHIWRKPLTTTINKWLVSAVDVGGAEVDEWPYTITLIFVCFMAMCGLYAFVADL
jgi:hypothetical protein